MRECLECRGLPTCKDWAERIGQSALPCDLPACISGRELQWRQYRGWARHQATTVDYSGHGWHLAHHGGWVVGVEHYQLGS